MSKERKYIQRDIQQMWIDHWACLKGTICSGFWVGLLIWHIGFGSSTILAPSSPPGRMKGPF